MNKLDTISEIWNHFQGCSNSVEAKIIWPNNSVRLSLVPSFTLFMFEQCWPPASRIAKKLTRDAVSRDATKNVGNSRHLS